MAANRSLEAEEETLYKIMAILMGVELLLMVQVSEEGQLPVKEEAMVESRLDIHPQQMELAQIVMVVPMYRPT